MSKNTLLSELINYVSANASGNVTIAAPSSGYALDVNGTGRFTGTLTGAAANFSSEVSAQTVSISNTTASVGLYISHTNTSYHAVSISSASSALYVTGSSSFNGSGYFTGQVQADSLGNRTGQGFTFPTVSGTLALTSDLSSCLPLSGGTLTGALSGTSATFTTGFNNTINIAQSSGSTTLGHLGQFADSLYISNNYYFNGSQSYDDTSKANSSIEMSTGVIYLKTGLANTVPSTKVTINSSGNVGIGTTSPSALLDVRGSSTLARIGIAGGAYVELSDNQLSAKTSAGAASTLYLNISGGNTILNRDSGNVGIGTTTIGSDFKLAVYGSNSLMAFQNTNTGQTNGDGFIVGSFGNVDAYLFNYENANIIVGTNGSERMRITSGGNVGIGLTNPQTQFHINGVMTFSEAGYDTVRLHKIEHTHSDGSSVNNTLKFLLSDGSGTTAERMRINGLGNLIVAGPVSRYNGTTVVGGSVTNLVNIDFGSSRTYLLSMIPVNVEANLSYRWFGVLQYNYNSNLFVATGLSTQTVDVTMSGGTIQARVTNGQQWTFNWSIIQLL